MRFGIQAFAEQILRLLSALADVPKASFLWQRELFLYEEALMSAIIYRKYFIFCRNVL